MSNRVEAAAKALCASDYEIHLGSKVEDQDALWHSYVSAEKSDTLRSVTAAIAAADQVMFSPDAVERAADALREAFDNGVGGFDEQARAVIAALRDN